MARVRGFSLIICLAVVLWANIYPCQGDHRPYGHSYGARHQPSYHNSYGKGASYGRRPQYFNLRFDGVFGSHGDSNHPSYVSSYGSSYDNSYRPPYYNSYGNSYPPSYDNSYGNSYPPSYDNSYGNSYPPSYDNSYGDSYQSSYSQDNSYDNRPRYFNPRFPQPYSSTQATPISTTTEEEFPITGTGQGQDYCRGALWGLDIQVQSFPPREFSLESPAVGLTFRLQGEVEAVNRKYGLIYSEDMETLSQAGAVRSRTKWDFGGAIKLFAVKTYDEDDRTTCYINIFGDCANVNTSPLADFDRYATTIYNYVTAPDKVTVPFTDTLQYKVIGDFSRSDLERDNPDLAQFCESSTLYRVDKGEVPDPPRQVKIFNDQGFTEFLWG